MLFLKAPAAKMSQKVASERAPERGFEGVFLVQNRDILLKSVVFLVKEKDSCSKRVKFNQK